MGLMNKRGMLMIWVIVAIAIVVGILIYSNLGNRNKIGSGSGACDADVKTCSDGSFVSRNANKNCAFDDCPSTTGVGSGNSAPRTLDVMVGDSGFSPSSLTIHTGDTVRWTNKRTVNSWPASAVHPTHKVYPGSDIVKCGTSEENTIFDACKGLNNNEVYSFTFNQVGTWGYHDHLHANLRGTIIVQ